MIYFLDNGENFWIAVAPITVGVLMDCSNPGLPNDQPQTYFPLLHSQLTYSTDDFPLAVTELLISRMYLNDRDLVRESAVEPADFRDYCAFELDESAKLDRMNIQDEMTENDDVTSFMKHMPRSFGSQKPRARKPEHHNKFRHKGWINTTSFEEYWTDVSFFAINKVWLEQFGEIMDPEERSNLEEEMMKSLPDYAIPAHKKCLGYAELVKSSPSYAICSSESWEKLFELHTNVVKEAAAKDYEVARVEAVTAKCKTFLKKIEDLGVSTGLHRESFEAKPLKSTVEQEDEGTVGQGQESAVKKENAEKKQEKKKVVNKRETCEKRKPMVYAQDDVFCDVLYSIQEPPTKIRLYLSQREDEKGRGGEGCSTDDATPSSSLITDPSDPSFSFDFDPEADAELLAKDAYKVFKHDAEIRKYWYQRFRLFSKLNHGIIMDREGWFSVTPERIAEHIADRMVLRKGAVIIDAFAGVGGNSIQLALKGANVIAIDLDPIRLKCAKRNAEVYGVADRIEFVLGNFFHVVAHWNDCHMGRGEVDSIFLSPPWGGPSYLQTKDFDLGTGCTPNGFDIFHAARRISPNIAYFLPRNTKMNQLISLAGPGGLVEMEQSCLNKKIKTITAYYGNLRKE